MTWVHLWEQNVEISGESNHLLVLLDCLLGLLIEPYSQVRVGYRPLVLLLRVSAKMSAAGAFVIRSATSLVGQDFLKSCFTTGARGARWRAGGMIEAWTVTFAFSQSCLWN